MKIICCIILLLFNYSLSEPGFSASTRQIMTDENTTIYTSLPSCIRVCTHDEQCIRNVERYWNLLPTGVQEAYKRSGWTMIILHGPDALESTFHTNYRIIGTTYVESQTQYVEDTPVGLRRAFIHEIGHWLDYYDDYWRSLDDRTWVDIYKEESSQIILMDNVDDHGYMDAREFYAEIFRHYIMYPNSCKRMAPKAYEYIQQHIEQLNFAP